MSTSFIVAIAAIVVATVVAICRNPFLLIMGAVTLVVVILVVARGGPLNGTCRQLPLWAKEDLGLEIVV